MSKKENKKLEIRPEAIDLMADNGLAQEVISGGVFMYQKQPGKPPKQVKFPGMMGLKYSGSETPMSIVGERYHVIQNWEFAEIALRIAEMANAEISSVKSYKGGARIRINIDKEDSPIEYTGGSLKGDQVKRIIHVETSHDGTAALNWGISNVVFSCTNGMTITKKAYSQSFRHTPNWQSQVKRSLEAFKKLAEKEEDVWETIQAMNNTQISSKGVDTFVEAVFSNYKKGSENNSTKTSNMVDKFRSIVESEMSQKGSTLWGAFNGLTYYNTHVRGYKEESRELSNAAGLYAQQTTDIFFGLRKAMKKRDNDLANLAKNN